MANEQEALRNSCACLQRRLRNGKAFGLCSQCKSMEMMRNQSRNDVILVKGIYDSNRFPYTTSEESSESSFYSLDEEKQNLLTEGFSTASHLRQRDDDAQDLPQAPQHSSTHESPFDEIRQTLLAKDFSSAGPSKRGPKTPIKVSHGQASTSNPLLTEGFSTATHLRQRDVARNDAQDLPQAPQHSSTHESPFDEIRQTLLTKDFSSAGPSNRGPNAQIKFSHGQASTSTPRNIQSNSLQKLYTLIKKWKVLIFGLTIIVLLWAYIMRHQFLQIQPSPQQKILQQQSDHRIDVAMQSITCLCCFLIISSVGNILIRNRE